MTIYTIVPAPGTSGFIVKVENGAPVPGLFDTFEDAFDAMMDAQGEEA